MSAPVMLGNEVAKGLRHAWAERLQMLIELPLYMISVLLFSLLLGRGTQVAGTARLPWQFDPYRTTWLFLGFAVFAFVYLQSAKTFWRLLTEIQTGTLEQTYLSPLPPWLTIAAGRIAAALVETALVVTALYLATSAIVDLTITWNPQVLPALAFAVIAGAGYSLIIAGLTLAWKRVELLQELVLVLMMFGSGAILPLDTLPTWVSEAAQPVFLTHAIAAVRTTLLDAHPIPVWGTGGWVWLSTTALTWLLLGILAFTAGNRLAKRQGTLTRY
jgi:ABC-2 type transport system permease protein